MTPEELKSELETLQKNIEGKTQIEVKSSFDAFETKVGSIIDQKANAVFLAQFETAKLEMEKKFAIDIKVVQDHADKLDIKLQKSDVRETKGKHINEVLAKAIEDNTDEYEKFVRKETKSFALELKAVGDMSTANVTGGTRYGQLLAPQIIEAPKRKVHMEQILPGGSIGAGNTFTFMRQNGVGEGNPAAVAEGLLKAQFDFDLEEATVNIETIAGWMRVTRKAMTNIPGFVSFLQSQIPERFQRVLDNQILYGSGTTPNLKGLLVAGNFVASTAPIANVLIEKLIKDIALLEGTYERDANVIVLRPADYYGFFLNKAAGSGEYDLPQGVTFTEGQMRLFGIPVFASTALTGTDYMVGDTMGSQLLTQESMRIEFFDQDGINVRENKVTVRVEGNYALPVYGADYFIKGTSALA